MGHDGQFYDPLIAQLKNRFKLTTFNYPDGLTKLDDLSEYYANKIEQTREKHSLVGLSLGATLSYKITELVPSQVNSLFAMASGGPKVARARKEMIHFAAQQMPPMDFIRKALSLDDFQTHFSNNTELAHQYAKKLRLKWNQAKKPAIENFLALIQDAVEVNYEQQMEQFQTKVELIWGGQDKVFTNRNFKKIQSCMPKANIHLLEQAGHYLPLEYPELVAKIILQHEISTF